MLHIILFLAAQLLAITCNSSLQSMTPAASLSTIPPATAHNNMLVFLNEEKNNPHDDLLSGSLESILTFAPMVHLVTTISTIEKFITMQEKILHTHSTQLSTRTATIFSSIYYINNSPYCLILPLNHGQNNNMQKNYDEQTLLDLSHCTPLCNPVLLAKESPEIIVNHLRETINNINIKLSQMERDQQIRESILIHQLLNKQIAAHKLFADDKFLHQKDFSSELYALATQPWHFYFLGHGLAGYSIAGFSFESGKIWKTLKLLNHLSTGYLIIYSCDAGGANRELLTGSNSAVYQSKQALDTLYKKHAQTIISLTLSYKVMLCSPADTIARTSSIFTALAIKNTATTELTDDAVIKIFSTHITALGPNVQINQLPLLKRPYQKNFEIFSSSLPNKPSHRVINARLLLSAITLFNHQGEKKIPLVDAQSVIQTNQSIITPGLIIRPAIKVINRTKLSQRSPEELSRIQDLNGYGHEAALPFHFPVITDTVFHKYTADNGDDYEQRPFYPLFLSIQTGQSFHYFPSIVTQSTDEKIAGERGVFLCLRDLFFNANTRLATQLYYIKNITGTNDIPQKIIDAKIFGENFPQEGENIRLDDVVIVTFCKGDNRLHYVFCAFSYEQSYFVFSVKLENNSNKKEWRFIERLPSKQAFEEKFCKIERFACSKIYHPLARYQKNHHLYDLVQQYRLGKKSIFLNFENSYSLFKDDHLPDDDNTWEKLPELLNQHSKNQKSPGSIAQHQLKNQETFVHIIKKLKEYQERNHKPEEVSTSAFISEEIQETRDYESTEH